MWTPPGNLTIYQTRPSDAGLLLRSVWVVLYVAHPRAEGHIYYRYLQTLSPVAHGRLNLPAEMLGPTHEQIFGSILTYVRQSTFVVSALSSEKTD